LRRASAGPIPTFSQERNVTKEQSQLALDPTIPVLGPCKNISSLPYTVWADGQQFPLIVDQEIYAQAKSPVTLSFEAAGPRKHLYFDPIRTKCAIVTCGGLCPGLNDVIRAIVMEAYHAYGMAGVLGIPYGLEGFIPRYGHRYIELTPDVVKQSHLFGGTMLGSSRGPQDPTEIVDTLERSNVNMLFIIGGDGTMRAGQAIYGEVTRRNLKIAIIGIPKTIDNDINFIPQSFGFETAVAKASEAIECAHIEATGTPYGIGLVKLMGRESGFIAAQACLAMKEVNFVLIPEAPFQLEGPGGLMPAVEERLRARRHCVIVTAEGAGQHLLAKSEEKDKSGNIILGNVSDLLKKAIKEHFKDSDISPSVKYIDPSYIIRSVPATPNDKVYCGFLGQYALHAAMAGRTGMVIGKLQSRFVHLPMELVTRERRHLDIHSDLWRAVLESTGQGRLKGMQAE
jgi:6-phosphofructokinase 1